MNKFYLIFSVLILTACQTPYQPMGFTGGYTQFPMSQDTYQVSFKGNGYTPQDAVQKMALLRAAELTLEKGYKSFEVVNGGFDTNPELIGFTSGSSTTSFHGFGHATTSYKPSQPLIARKASGNITIKMYKTKRKNALIAQKIYDEIYPTVAKSNKTNVEAVTEE